MKTTKNKFEETLDLSRSTVSPDGRRVVFHPVHLLTRFFQDVLDFLDRETARRVLTGYGFSWGESDAQTTGELADWGSTEEWIGSATELLVRQGFAQSEVETLVFDEEVGTVDIGLVWHDFLGFEPEPQDDGCPVSWIFSGYVSGYVSYCSGVPVYFLEEPCATPEQGRLCLRGRDRDSWGDDAETMLSFFENDGLEDTLAALRKNLRDQVGQHSPGPSPHAKRSSSAFITVDSKAVEVQSEAFLHVLEISNRVAAFDLPILLTGESGTGKEVLARHAHMNSARKDGPFIGINCAALQETLLASELFGYRAGAFTGATKDRRGMFEEANGGTIFLDEIGDVPPSTQVALLRVLQEQEVTRLGENRPRKIDVRIMAATNRDLNQAIEDGTFREDLYYRLGVVAIELPPLRDRKEDIIPLARHFLAEISGKLKIDTLELDGACLDYLLTNDWPGNVRELKNSLERAAVMTRDGLIKPADLMPGAIQTTAAQKASAGGSVDRTLEEVEMEHIKAVLAATDGNRARAARMLNISPATLWRKLKQVEEE